MKQLILVLSIASLLIACGKQNPQAENSDEQIPEQALSTIETTAFDSTLAAEFGADDYGMKSYVMAFLKAGPNRSSDPEEAARLQRAHMDNIGRMANEGKLVLAGPFLDNGELRGIYIFNVATVEEAAELTATDPAIQAGRLVMELHPWYGTAILPIVAPMSQRLEKSSWVR